MNAYRKFNDWVAVQITNGVASMTCAYIFGLLAIYGGTGVHWNKPFEVVQWISQTFLQLVLLSVIMVGQKVVAAGSDAQAKEMHDAVMEEFKDIKEMHSDLKELVEALCHGAKTPVRD